MDTVLKEKKTQTGCVCFFLTLLPCGEESHNRSRKERRSLSVLLSSLLTSFLPCLA